MTKFRDKNVLITGGANGIGKLMGIKAIKKGVENLIIWDINEENLEKTYRQLKAMHMSNIHPYLVDISNIKDIEKNGTKVLLDIGNVDILINNAGVVTGKPFIEHSSKDIEKTIDINVKGVMHTTRVFLPDMIRQGFGHVVNIASASGLVPLPNGSVYGSSKWAVLGWSESLRVELERMAGDLHVTTICPSYIDTGMFEGVKAPLLAPLLKPEDIVNKIFKATEKNKQILYAPAIVNLIPFLKGILPSRALDMAAQFLGVYQSMDTFRGKTNNDTFTEKKAKKKA